MRSIVRDAALVAAVVSAVQGLPAAPPSQAQTCNVELAIDRPAEAAEVSARERITGWALDRAATQGTGIEAVRVALDVAPDRADDQVYLPLVYGIPGRMWPTRWARPVSRRSASPRIGRRWVRRRGSTS